MSVLTNTLGWCTTTWWITYDIDFQRCIHGNDTKASDNLGRVGNLLRAQEKAVLVSLPVLVEMIEPKIR